MGRTIQSATQTWIEEERALKRFTRALRREDQRLMIELVSLSRLHIAEASYASNLFPMDVYLISMLLETFKGLRQAEKQIDQLCEIIGIVKPDNGASPDLPDLISLLGSADDPE